MRVHKLNNVNKALEILKQNNVSSTLKKNTLFIKEQKKLKRNEILR